MAQLVAHHTGSVGVTGSSPVSSTKLNPCQLRLAGICLLCRPCKVLQLLVEAAASGFRIGSGLGWGGARCRWLVMMLDHRGVLGTVVVVGRIVPGPPCCPSPGPAPWRRGPGWQWWTYSPQPCRSTAGADAGVRACPNLRIRWPVMDLSLVQYLVVAPQADPVTPHECGGLPSSRRVRIPDQPRHGPYPHHRHVDPYSSDDACDTTTSNYQCSCVPHGTRL